MPTKTFFNIEVESEAGADAVLRMIDWLKTQPSIAVKETMTWVTVIAVIPPSTSPIIQPISQKWKVVVPVWNIRARPSMLDNVQVLGQLKQGEIIIQFEENATWVRHDGGGIPARVGWSGKRGLERVA